MPLAPCGRNLVGAIWGRQLHCTTRRGSGFLISSSGHFWIPSEIGYCPELLCTVQHTSMANPPKGKWIDGWRQHERSRSRFTRASERMRWVELEIIEITCAHTKRQIIICDRPQDPIVANGRRQLHSLVPLQRVPERIPTSLTTDQPQSVHTSEAYCRRIGRPATKISTTRPLLMNITQWE